MPDAIIFDIDGTLLDSVDLHARAWQEALRRFGHDVPLDRIRSQIGKGGDQLLPVFLGDEELETKQKDIQEFRSKLFKQKYLPLVKPFPGVRELFQKVLASGQKAALASSAKGDELKSYERLADIEDLVGVETSSADAERSKPRPDIFEAALERLGKDVGPENTIIVGDSPYDAKAAEKAGMLAVGVLCGGFSEDSLWAAGCAAIFKGPADLLRQYDRSPLARRQAAGPG